MKTYFLPSPTPTPSLSPGFSPHHPFRSAPCVYWYYPYPMGHGPAQDQIESRARYDELLAELAPHVREGEVPYLREGEERIDVLTVLQVLDELIIPCALGYPHKAMWVWLQHLQKAITAMKLYAFAFPLTRYEKDLIQNFAYYWSQKRGGPCDMGRPEAQIVLSTLMEMARC